jgi:ankyrin repeat protein
MVLNGAGGWENRKTLATNAKMRRREGKEGREAVGKKPIAGRRHRKQLRHQRKHQTIATSDKTPNHSHRPTNRSPGARYWLRASSSSFNTDLYRRAVGADDAVLKKIVGWVLSRYRLASLTLLLDNGLSANYTAHFYLTQWKGTGTMLHFLCERPDQKRSVPLARLLLERGADTKAIGSRYSDTVLHRAIHNTNCEIATLLLAHGADLNAVGRDGDTPLHFASGINEARMVPLLIMHGVAVDGRREADGSTPLFSAIIRSAKDAIPMLLAHGADAGAHNNFGMTPLHYLSRCRWDEGYQLLLESAKLLLAHGAVVNAIDDNGETPLHWASKVPPSRRCGFFMVKFLLENGAEVNAISKDRCTPLQEAISKNNEGVVVLLLRHGADVEALNGGEREQLFRMRTERYLRITRVWSCCY